MIDKKYNHGVGFELMRYDLLNTLIKTFDLKRYLEIGVYRGETSSKVNILHKDGVDNGADGEMCDYVSYLMSSDEFWKNHSTNEKYDIVFIDGLHVAEQVMRDIEGAMSVLSDRGFIVLHDCIPFSYEAQLQPKPKGRSWNGDCWKAMASFIRNNPDYECLTVGSDHGLGVIRFDPVAKPNFTLNNYSWPEFVDNGDGMLNIVDVMTFNRFMPNCQRILLAED